MPIETTLDSLSVELPEGAEAVDTSDHEADGGAQGESHDHHHDAEARGQQDDDGRYGERTWMTDDGMYVALSLVPAERGPDLDPFSLDLVVGGSVERYCSQFGGTVGAYGAVEVRGASDARFAYLSMRSSRGEEIELAMVGALTADRKVATLQISWPVAGAEHHRQGAAAVGASFALPG